MQIGDFIACKYTASSGAAGTFSEMGAPLATAQAAEIPVAGSATPNGYFYFLKADKGLLISNRVVRHSVSWDTLNAAKYIQGLYCGPVLLMHMEGVDNSTNFVDSSPYNRAITTYGSPIIRTNDYETGNSSLYLNGASCLYFTSNNNIWASDFTLDIKFKRDSMGAGTQVLLAQGGPTGYVQVTSIDVLIVNNVLQIGVPTSSVNITRSTGTTIIDTNPHKIRVIRQGNTLQLFLDGNLEISHTITAWSFNGASYKIAIGAPGEFIGYMFKGYINEIKILSYAATSSINSSATPIEGLNNKGFIIRSLSGGVAYLGADGKPSLTHKNLGAWPPINEWDKYIVNSNLGSKITPGDDNVWNHKNINLYSLCKNTTLSGTFTDSFGNSFAVSSTMKIVRGNFIRGQWHDIGFATSSQTAMVGFRPVLEYIDPKSKAASLWC